MGSDGVGGCVSTAFDGAFIHFYPLITVMHLSGEGDNP